MLLSLISLPFSQNPHVIIFLSSQVPSRMVGGLFAALPSCVHWPSSSVALLTPLLCLCPCPGEWHQHPHESPLSQIPYNSSKIRSIFPPKCLLNVLVLFLSPPYSAGHHQCCLDGSNSLLTGLPACSLVPFPSSTQQPVFYFSYSQLGTPHGPTPQDVASSLTIFLPPPALEAVSTLGPRSAFQPAGRGKQRRCRTREFFFKEVTQKLLASFHSIPLAKTFHT